jgi:GntR family transcriptional regulator
MVTFPILIDIDDALPIYAQIERQLRALLTGGHWKAGDRLPSVRETAVRLRVNPLTVVKAYRHLQEEGLLDTRPGAGVYAANVPMAPKPARREAARRALQEAISGATAQGLTQEEISELFEGALLRQKGSEAP